MTKNSFVQANLGFEMRVFGYGSLIWRPGFVFEARAVATLHGWKRALAQGSPDHRGTPERLGRVVTLLEDAEAHCEGVVFTLLDATVEATLHALDEREQGGYVRREVDVVERDTHERVRAVTWVADRANPYFLGEPQDLGALVAHIAGAHGPSGSNTEYVLRLADALRAHGITDEGIFALARGLSDQ